MPIYELHVYDFILHNFSMNLQFPNLDLSHNKKGLCSDWLHLIYSHTYQGSVVCSLSMEMP